MRPRPGPSVATLLAALLLAGCAARYEVKTIAAPEISAAGLRSFRLLPVPPPRDGRERRDVYDPMADGSVANRALRETIADALGTRGYVRDEIDPDVLVAVYAGARETLDVTVWDYGYPFWPRWELRAFPPEWITEYTEGTVIVDVLRPRTRTLLWRGSATARLTKDAADDVGELRKVAVAIIDELPRARPRPIAQAP